MPHQVARRSGGRSRGDRRTRRVVGRQCVGDEAHSDRQAVGDDQVIAGDRTLVKDGDGIGHIVARTGEAAGPAKTGEEDVIHINVAAGEGADLGMATGVSIVNHVEQQIAVGVDLYAVSYGTDLKVVPSATTGSTSGSGQCLFSPPHITSQTIICITPFKDITVCVIIVRGAEDNPQFGIVRIGRVLAGHQTEAKVGEHDRVMDIATVAQVKHSVPDLRRGVEARPVAKRRGGCVGNVEIIPHERCSATRWHAIALSQVQNRLHDVCASGIGERVKRPVLFIGQCEAIGALHPAIVAGNVLHDRRDDAVDLHHTRLVAQIPYHIAGSVQRGSYRRGGRDERGAAGICVHHISEHRRHITQAGGERVGKEDVPVVPVLVRERHHQVKDHQAAYGVGLYLGGLGKVIEQADVSVVCCLAGAAPCVAVSDSLHVVGIVAGLGEDGGQHRAPHSADGETTHAPGDHLRAAVMGRGPTRVGNLAQVGILAAGRVGDHHVVGRAGADVGDIYGPGDRLTDCIHLERRLFAHLKDGQDKVDGCGRLFGVHHLSDATGAVFIRQVYDVVGRCV